MFKMLQNSIYIANTASLPCQSGSSVQRTLAYLKICANVIRSKRGPCSYDDDMQ